MSCYNTIQLACLSNPTVIIQPCTPVINGIVGSAFVLGNLYYNVNDGINWSAVTGYNVTSINSGGDFASGSSPLPPTSSCEALLPCEQHLYDVEITQQDIDDGPYSSVSVNFGFLWQSFQTAGVYSICVSDADTPSFYWGNGAGAIPIPSPTSYAVYTGVACCPDPYQLTTFSAETCCTANPMYVNGIVELPANFTIGTSFVSVDGVCYVVISPMAGIPNIYWDAALSAVDCEDCISKYECPSYVINPTWEIWSVSGCCDSVFIEGQFMLLPPLQMPGTVFVATDGFCYETVALAPSGTVNLYWDNGPSKTCIECVDENPCDLTYELYEVYDCCLGFVEVMALPNTFIASQTILSISGECFTIIGVGGSVETVVWDGVTIYNSCDLCLFDQPCPTSTYFISCCGNYIINNNVEGNIGQTYSSECDGSCWTCILPEGQPSQNTTLALVELILCSDPICTDCTLYQISNNSGSIQYYDWIDCNGTVQNSSIADGDDLEICACVILFNYFISCYEFTPNIVATLLGAGCISPTPTPEPTPTITPTPTPTYVTPTPTPTPTETPTPTPTETPTPTPTETPTPTPTETPTPTPTETPTPEPTPTITPTQSITPIPVPTETPTIVCPVCVCTTIEYVGSSLDCEISYINCYGIVSQYLALKNVPHNLCVCNETQFSASTCDVGGDFIYTLNGYCSNGVTCDNEPTPTPTPTPTTPQTVYCYEAVNDTEGICEVQYVDCNTLDYTTIFVPSGVTVSFCTTLVTVDECNICHPTGQICVECVCVVPPTPTPTETPTPTPTETPTPTPTETPTPTPTETPTPTPTETPTPTPTETPTPTPTSNCTCLQVDSNLVSLATGNTNPSLNDIVEINYTDCDGNSQTYIQTVNALFYICTLNGVIDLVSFYQDDVLVSSSTPLTNPWQPYPGTLNGIGYGNYGSCSGNSCGPTPIETPTPTPTETPTPTPTTPQDECEIIVYCLSGTGNSSWNGNYTRSGLYNGKFYWVNDSNTFYIYFDSVTNQWCLSDSLGGNCLLSGKSPCYSICPDLCDDYLNEGDCLPPGPTPEPPCDVDFTALFDCEYEPTPSATPTPTPTPTPTITPTPTDPCLGVGVDASISSINPTPTPTPTITPTPTPTIIRPCNFLGNVTFNTINGLIKCPSSKQFQDCFNGDMYYTTSTLENPTLGEDIEPFMVFEALVDGISKCVSYVGINNDTIGINQIELVVGPFGYSNLGDCIYCTPQINPTPTPSPTITPTPTPTITPTPTPTSIIQTYYVYVNCLRPDTVLVQTLPALTTNIGSVLYDMTTEECWQFDYQSVGYPQLNPQLNVINYTGNYLSNASNQIYIDCESCLSPSPSTPTPTVTPTPTPTVTPTPTPTPTITPTSTPECIDVYVENITGGNPYGSDAIRISYTNCSGNFQTTSPIFPGNSVCIFTTNINSISGVWADASIPPPINGIDYNPIPNSCP
jgi:hypothetical protein